MICHYCVHIGHQYCLGAGCECPTCAEKKSQAPTPSGPKWTPPKLIVKAFIDPLAWGIRTADYDEPVCEIPQREHAKQYADLFVASPELLEALEPDDRLNAGNVIHAGYKSKSSVETVHLLHCCLAQLIEHPERFAFANDQIGKVKTEMDRLMEQAEKALAKARGESPDAN